MSRKANLVRGQSGMTLVEIMVVVAMIGILSAAISSLAVHLLNQSNIMKLRMEMASLQTELEIALRKQPSCTSTMRANSVVLPGTVTLANIGLYEFDNPGAPGSFKAWVVPAIGPLPASNNRMRITEMRLQDLVQISVSGGTREWVGAVRVVVQHNFEGIPQPQPIVIRGINFFTDLAGNVNSCRSLATLMVVTGEIDCNGATSISYASPGAPTTFGTVFTAINSGGNRGIQCNSPGWLLSGCRGSSLVGPSNAMSVESAISINSNQCTAPTGAFSCARGSRLYVTCFSMN